MEFLLENPVFWLVIISVLDVSIYAFAHRKARKDIEAKKNARALKIVKDVWSQNVSDRQREELFRRFGDAIYSIHIEHDMATTNAVQGVFDFLYRRNGLAIDVLGHIRESHHSNPEWDEIDYGLDDEDSLIDEKVLDLADKSPSLFMALWHRADQRINGRRQGAAYFLSRWLLRALWRHPDPSVRMMVLRSFRDEGFGGAAMGFVLDSDERISNAALNMLSKTEPELTKCSNLLFFKAEDIEDKDPDGAPVQASDQGGAQS